MNRKHMIYLMAVCMVAVARKADAFGGEAVHNPKYWMSPQERAAYDRLTQQPMVTPPSVAPVTTHAWRGVTPAWYMRPMATTGSAKWVAVRSLANARRTFGTN